MEPNFLLLIKFAGDYFHAGKNWWIFFFIKKTMQKNLVGIPSDEICPPKFIQGEILV